MNDSFARFFCVVIAFLCAIAISTPAQDDKPQEAALLRSFEDLLKDFNDQNPVAIMKNFSKDVVLSYYGLRDQGYDSIQAAFNKMFAVKIPTKRHEAEIKAIRVSGDLGFIHVYWTASAFSKKQNKTIHYYENDLEVWEKKEDGWKLVRGMSNPVK